jgi:serine/threonine protein kinase
MLTTEVHIGRFLGKGGFGVVCEVAKVELDDGAESTATTVAIELSNSSRTYPGYELFMKDYKANNFAGTAAQKHLPPPPPPILADHRGFGSATAGNHKKANKSPNQKKRETVQDRDFIAANYKRRTTTTSTKTTGRLGRLFVLGRTQKVKARYAIKRLKDNCLDSGENFVNGVIDLAIEARFLSVLRHPNIIKMRATAMTDPFSPEDPYFIVLDKLDDILGKRLVQWAAREQSVVRKLHCQSHRVEQDFWMERIKVAHDVANALKYLHSRQYVSSIGASCIHVYSHSPILPCSPLYSQRPVPRHQTRKHWL